MELSQYKIEREQMLLEASHLTQKNEDLEEKLERSQSDL